MLGIIIGNTVILVFSNRFLDESVIKLIVEKYQGNPIKGNIRKMQTLKVSLVCHSQILFLIKII